MRCDECGVESELDELFHATANKGKQQSYCPRCWNRHAARNWIRGSAKSTTILIIALASLSLVDNTFFRDIVILFSAILLSVILILPHELGHAFFATLVRFRVFQICVGNYGPTIFRRRLFGTTILVKSIPFGGCCRVVPTSDRWIRTKLILVYLGGPLVNAILLALTIRWLAASTTTGWRYWLALSFGLANLSSLISNLWPAEVTTAEGKTENDGLALLKVPFYSDERIAKLKHSAHWVDAQTNFGEGKLDDARQECEAGLRTEPDSFSLQFTLGTTLCRLGEFDQARRIFERLRSHEECTHLVEPYVFNNLAWAILRMDSTALDAADNYSRQALQLMPWEPYLKATRGGVLVARGESELAIEILEQAYDEVESNWAKAFIACDLATACLRTGDKAKAERFVDQAKRLDPDCLMIRKVAC